MWRVEIVESTNILEGIALDITALLNRRAHEGWVLRHMMPNGVNRWTLTFWRDGAS